MQARLRRLLTGLILGMALPGLAAAQNLTPQTPETPSPSEKTDTQPLGRFPLPDSGDIVGQVQTVEADAEDTLIDIGLRHGIGYNAIRAANPDTLTWLPGEGTEVTLPTRYILPPGPREGIVINIAELRLYYYPPAKDGEVPRVETYPIGIGRLDWKTPLGTTRITARVEDPAWYPPESIIKEYAQRGIDLPSVVPGPDNPLGDYAMILGIPGYLIHGTNRPQGVGMRVSHGCIRMLPNDIEDLIYRVPVGTPVRLINQPLKLGWTQQGILHAQTYPVPETTPAELAKRTAQAFDAVSSAVAGRRFLVDYAQLKRMLENPSGMPEALSLMSSPFEIPKPPVTFYERLVSYQTLYSQVKTALPEPAIAD